METLNSDTQAHLATEHSPLRKAFGLIPTRASKTRPRAEIVWIGPEGMSWF